MENAQATDPEQRSIVGPTTPGVIFSHHRCNLIFSPLFSSLLRERTRAPHRHLQVVAASSTRWSPPPCAPAGRAPPSRPPAGRSSLSHPLVVRRRRCGLRWSGVAAAASYRSDAAASSDGRAPPCPPTGWASRLPAGAADCW
jgi:hypothetical protein